MSKRLKKKFLKSRLFSHFLNILLNIYLFTLKVEYENEEEFMNHITTGGAAILSTSHQHLFAGFKGYKKYMRYTTVAAIVSKSNDGDILTTIGLLNGYTAIRGSSSKDGKEAMEVTIEYLTDNNTIVAIAPDGPKGPLGVVKPGTIRIAQKSGAVIFPCSAIADSAWQAGSWDKNQIPKPFSKVTMIFCKKIIADSIETTEEFENKRVELQNSLANYIIK